MLERGVANVDFSSSSLNLRVLRAFVIFTWANLWVWLGWKADWLTDSAATVASQDVVSHEHISVNAISRV